MLLPRQPTKCEDADLVALLLEGPCQTQGELAQSSGATQQVIKITPHCHGNDLIAWKLSVT